jgi:hypothetical protein
VIEHSSRRLVHYNVTAHPSAAWTLQQLREAIGLQERYKYQIHDRDSIFANHLDKSIGRLGAKVLKSPPHSPMAGRIWRWVPVSTIRRSPLPTTHIQIRAIAVENRTRSGPTRSLAACITNTFSSRAVRD